MIQVDLTIRSNTRPTMFIVITSRAIYNLLLGRKWIRGIGAVPSSLNQRISIWRDDGIVENLKANQIYFMVEVNHVNKRHFDKNLVNIAPCSPAVFPYMTFDKPFYFLTLHPTHSFNWDKEIMGEVDVVQGVLGLRPTG